MMVKGSGRSKKQRTMVRCGYPDGLPEQIFFHRKYGPLEWFIRQFYFVPPGRDQQEAWGAAMKIVEIARREVEAPGGRGVISHLKSGSWTTRGATVTTVREVTIPITKPPAQAIQAFNALAQDVSIRLKVDSNGRPVIIPGEDPKATVVRWLWDIYFRPRAWDRVKRCARCNVWFVDKTKNRGARFGSQACKERFYNRRERSKSKLGLKVKVSRKRKEG